MTPNSWRWCRSIHSSAAFRDIVKAVAAGLRLQVVEVDAKGVVLMAMTDSPFALDPGTLRASSKADDRLLDGLIQIAIAATVFPRPATLDDDPSLARPPITAQDVEHTLRDLCERLAADAQHEADPALSDVRAGLIEAWRVFRVVQPCGRHRTIVSLPARRWDDWPQSRNPSRAGCFFLVARPGIEDDPEHVVYQPTWRYQVQMQDFSASELFTVVTTMLATDASSAALPAASSSRVGA